MRAEVTDIRHQTGKSVTLRLRPNDNWLGFRAGQFVLLTVTVNGVQLARSYSLAGSEHAPNRELELTVSTHPDGRVSRHLRDNAQRGMIVGLSQAQGEFVLPQPRPQRILLISGGSGITPVMSILRTLCDEQFDGEIGFLNYARSPQLALYERELQDLAAAASHGPVRTERGYTRAANREIAGRFAPEHLDSVLADRAGASTYVCGPPTLVEAVRDACAQEDLSAPSVEMFTPPLLRPSDLAAGGVVRFVASGVEQESSGRALLDQAEDCGLVPEFGCRMGICNTCSVRKRSGTVQNLVSGALSGPGEERIRICVSVPAGDVDLDL